MSSSKEFSSPSILKATGLFKTFQKRLVVKDVSITLSTGEIVGLMGPNGAGKTTTFSMIAGLVNPDRGSITFDKENVTHDPIYMRARKGLGYLPQESSIFRGLSVEDNILAVLEISESDEHKRHERLHQLLDEFDIKHLRHSPAPALSGGERRRLEIARALAPKPKFLLLDEPFAGVDPISIGEVRDLILHLKKRSIGVLITDHNVRETLDIVDRGYIMAHGSVLMTGSPEDILNHKDVRRVYLGERFTL
jgi:lipopolysaccharide export system ATP-binding protein